MADARFDQVGIDIEALAAADGSSARYALRATGQTLVFDGFLKLYREGRDDEPDEDAESMLPELTAEQALGLLEVLPEQHFTQPPPRFSEATLVKKLEEEGIGRPSTYASIISTIQDRGYVRLEDRRFWAEDVGYVVTDKLVEHFPDVVDVGFTRYMEKELDDIAEGELGKVQMLAGVQRAPSSAPSRRPRTPSSAIRRSSTSSARSARPRGGSPAKLQVKLGRYGKFIGCPNYPECRYIRNMDGTERARARAARRAVPRVRPSAPVAGRPLRPVRRVQRLPRLPLHQERAAAVARDHLPPVRRGGDRREAHALRPVLRLQPLPRLRLRGQQRAARRAALLRVDGSLLLQRPKSIRCWGCGSEFDLDMQMTKQGDPEAEAAARAAKSAARAARAAAKAAKGGRRRARRRRPPSGRRPPRRTTTKKKSAATTSRTKAATANGEASAAEPVPAAES